MEFHICNSLFRCRDTETRHGWTIASRQRTSERKFLKHKWTEHDMPLENKCGKVLPIQCRMLTINSNHVEFDFSQKELGCAHFARIFYTWQIHFIQKKRMKVLFGWNFLFLHSVYSETEKINIGTADKSNWSICGSGVSNVSEHRRKKSNLDVKLGKYRINHLSSTPTFFNRNIPWALRHLFRVSAPNIGVCLKCQTTYFN